MSLASIKTLLFGRPSRRRSYSAVPNDDPDLENPHSQHNRDGDREDEAESHISTSSSITARSDSGSTTSTHKFDSRLLSDAIIGLSDGLTVPFALTAGLSALGDTKVVVLGGLAELIAGGISMGLGGWLGARCEEESYTSLRRSTHSDLLNDPASLTSTIADVLSPYAIPESLTTDLTAHIQKLSSQSQLDFIMQFAHALPPGGDGEDSPPSRAWTCAITISSGYFLGGFVPLLPYFFASSVSQGLRWSICIMALALFIFGWVKTGVSSGWRGRQNIGKCLTGAIEMVVIGGLAAGAAMGVVWGFQRIGG
ncbi:DUF125-domain-containing protein [Aulographum hederae CBS 113979]|uniref:DUF125-domain-containing protein n=1 Tax=Aulographum hederae CBS 113979 TaxID=1176131 RepID=A0A6G1H7Z5_9PEZI|nr:DUF125-domain-containing protein [Aulographum hederae CBS 113979]